MNIFFKALIVISLIGNWTSTVQSQTRTSVKDGDFFDEDTWDCNCEPNRNESVVINHHITANSNMRLINMTIGSTGQFDLSANLNLFGDLDIVSGGLFDCLGRVNARGDWNNEGTFLPNTGTVVIRKDGTSNISGSTRFYKLRVRNSVSLVNTGSIEIVDYLRLTDGDLYTGNDLTLLSTLSRTGRVYEISSGSTIIGDLTQERYFESNNNNWHLIGSPIVGATLNDWNDDILTTGFPGADYPDFYFNNATYYDERVPGDKDLGLNEASDINETIETGKGWRMYLPTGNRTLDVTGPINQGNVNIPITYTSTGSPLDDGWNLISNPYPSAINWDDADWTKVNVNDAVFIWRPDRDQYTSYVNGVGTNGGSKFIPSSQAFWIQANGNSPVLEIEEGAKSGSRVQFRSTRHEFVDHFKIELRSQENGYKDELAIRINDRCSDDFEADFDAIEFRSPNLEVPGISVLGKDSIYYSIYATSVDEQVKLIPINISINTSGVYDFSFSNTEKIFNVGCVILHDKKTNTLYKINGDEVLSFNLEADQDENRFLIKICSESPSNIEVKINESKPEATIEIESQNILVDVSEMGEADYRVIITDILGRTIVDRDYENVYDNPISVELPIGLNQYIVSVTNLVNGNSSSHIVQLGQ